LSIISISGIDVAVKTKPKDDSYIFEDNGRYVLICNRNDKGECQSRPDNGTYIFETAQDFEYAASGGQERKARFFMRAGALYLARGFVCRCLGCGVSCAQSA
jgi:hypothetical protein